MSLMEDIDDLMWPVIIKYEKALFADEWCELENWCNEQFGKNGWWLEKNVMRFRKEEHATMFVLRWS